MWHLHFSTASFNFIFNCGIALAQGTSHAVPTRGSMMVHQGASIVTLDYSTPSPSSSNWIGIFAATGGGPINGQKVTNPLAWAWATEDWGNLTFSTADLAAGYSYKAFLLGGENQFEQLANPVEFLLSGSGGDVHFFVNSTNLRNGRVGQDYRANIGGLLSNLPDHTYKFAKTSCTNCDWVKISNTGEISGRPLNSGRTQIIIEASNNSGTNSSIIVSIEVVDDGVQLVDTLNVVTLNLWKGGSNVDNFHEKQVRFLNSISADIVGLQECGDTQAATMIAQALGWYSLQYEDVGAVSKYPIISVEPSNPRNLQMRIALDGDDQQVILWNTHSTAYPYGPYEPCFNGTGTDAIHMAEESSGRVGQVKELITAMATNLKDADNIPVLLTGDFNAPSHLDWIPEASKLHCNISSFSWPTSKLLSQEGLIDSYREEHPDPVAFPGVTWSPIFLNNPKYADKPEPLDRIDFIYYRGKKLSTDLSNAIIDGSPKPEDPDPHRENEWTSDHKAVWTSFKFAS
ncbi:endonuclease/exonuclease/phosphatase family [Mariannaea sp. PMI_226]|nr:endonuclease/exonuclease/phosphatase family [Mariannaea sp. PMI_226]